MSAFVKTKVKAARDAIGKKDYEKARELALGVLEYEPDNYHAYVISIPPVARFCGRDWHSNLFLGLAYFNLKQYNESEQVTATSRCTRELLVIDHCRHIARR